MTVRFQQQLELNVTAVAARRTVNQMLHLEFSTQMTAGEPILQLAETAADMEPGSACWQVPVHLTFPEFGDVGRVGTVCVDTKTGEISQPSDELETLRTRATALASRLTSTTALPG